MSEGFGTADTIAIASLILTCIGFVATIGGLGVALKQLSAVKTETEATSAAISSVQFKVESFDASRECQISEGIIQQIRKSLKGDDAYIVIEHYQSLSDSFLKLSHADSVISQDDRTRIQSATEDIAKVCEGIRRRNSSEEGKGKFPQGQDRLLRDLSDIIHKISFLISRDLRK